MCLLLLCKAIAANACLRLHFRKANPLAAALAVLI
jgi:hypothetical protein